MHDQSSAKLAAHAPLGASVTVPVPDPSAFPGPKPSNDAPSWVISEVEGSTSSTNAALPSSSPSFAVAEMANERVPQVGGARKHSGAGTRLPSRTPPPALASSRAGSLQDQVSAMRSGSDPWAVRQTSAFSETVSTPDDRSTGTPSTVALRVTSGGSFSQRYIEAFAPAAKQWTGSVQATA